MKKLLVLATVLFAFSAKAQHNKEVQPATLQAIAVSGTLYGTAFDETNSMTVDEVVNRVLNKELNQIAVRGKINEVCQAEGCWMRVDRTGGHPMLVKFKDHAFTIPKNLAGKDVVFFGRAYQTTVSVKMLQHYAEDAGKSKEEIAAITEPSTEIAFEATGLIIK